MSLKTDLAEAKTALAALKSRIEADDAEAIKQGEQLAQTIAEKTAQIEAAEKKTAILGALGGTDTNKEDSDMNSKTKTISDAVKSMDLDGIKANHGSTSAMVDVKAATDAVTGSTAPTYSQAEPREPEHTYIRDLFAAESIGDHNALTYFVLGPVEGTPGVVAEGTKKPQIHPTYTPKTESLTKHAAYFKETDELLEDLPYLESVIRGRAIRAVRKTIDVNLVTKLLATDGINVTVNNGITFDNILRAKLAINADTGYEPDAVVINPADLQTLLLTKDGNNQYMMGGPAYAPYGGGAYGNYLPIWGMRVMASSAIAAGTALVGAFRDGASVVTKDGEGMRVEVSNSNEDDFVHNMVTVRMEERLLLAVRTPGAFAKITASA